MLTEAVQDGGQAMRDPVGGSVEFHFVPILKLISTLLIMGVFDDEDVTHILKMLEPVVFSGKRVEEPVEDNTKKEEEITPPKQVKESQQETAEEEEEEEEEEYEDDGLGEEEEEEYEEEEEEIVKPEPEVQETEPVNGEKGAEETEKEAETKVEQGLEQGLFQMKLPESVKLQVGMAKQLHQRDIFIQRLTTFQKREKVAMHR